MLSTAAGADVELVKQHISAYCIYHAPDAPSSVRLAASELKEYLAKATRVVLPVVTRDRAPTCPMVSLGENVAARAAGLMASQIPLEGFRIATRGGNVYILGVDTADGRKTNQGGTSTGTLNGVYTFLEDYIGVRWLMPGGVGEYVPNLDAITIREVDRTEGPAFASRRIVYIQEKDPLVAQWLRRQKQGSSLSLSHGHSWATRIPPDLFDKHPEWFPMIGGTRIPPVGDRYKLETTDPALVQAFADNVIEEFRKNPTQYSASISPTDSAYWSASPESVQLYDKDSYGRTSMTRLVLNFYDSVARITGRSEPDKLVCGYIYSDYLYAPTMGVPKLEPNLCLVLAPHISYGYGLYRQEARTDWENLANVWAKASSITAYYDLPVIFTQSFGAPNPPGLEILKFVYPKLASNGFKGVYVYGVSAWGQGAVTNYLLAKLNWRPTSNVDETAEEFFRLAYGPEAGQTIASIYRQLDAATKRHYSNRANSGVLDREALNAIYVPMIAQIENLYARADSQMARPEEKARLELLRRNLDEFYHYLQGEGLVDKMRASAFSNLHGDDALVINGTKLEVGFATAHGKTDISTRPIKVHLRTDESQLKSARPVEPFLLRGKLRAVVYPSGDGNVTLEITQLKTYGDVVRYVVYDDLGSALANGSVTEASAIRFRVPPGRYAVFDLDAESAYYGIDVKGARFAVDTAIQPKGLHFIRQFTPMYFFVPENFGPFSVTISGWKTGQHVAIELMSPDGRMVNAIELGGQLATRIKADSGPIGGFWMLRLEKSGILGTDDIWAKLDDRLSPWVILNPNGRIIVGKGEK